MNQRFYRPEIDGLRAVAVIPVVLFHLAPDWLGGGFLGVDVFFVISGFLITTIVLDDLRKGVFSLRNFCSRRIRRIMPALVAMVGCTLAAAFLLLPRFDHAPIGRQAIAALVSVANVYFWRVSGDYWGQQAEQMPLLHTWSLSVEEQFYLLFPLAMWMIWAWRPSWLTPLLALATVGSFAVFAWGLGRNGTFYLLPTRAWELSVGCVLAGLSASAEPDSTGGVKEQPEAGRLTWSERSSWLAILGLAMILMTYATVSGLTIAVVFTVIGTALVLAFSQRGPCRVILSTPALVTVGKASYSLYLWHWPLLVFAAHPNFEMNRWFAGGLSCVAAAASYQWIEKRTRRAAGVAPTIVVGYLGVLVAAYAMTFTHGEYDTTGFSRPATHAYCYNVSDVAGEEYRRTVARAGMTHELYEPTFASDAWQSGGVLVGSAAKPRVVVMGDSHGTAWSHAIHQSVLGLDVTTSFLSAMGVSPFGGFPQTAAPPSDAGYSQASFQKVRLACIAAWHPDVVLVSARWSKYARRDVVDLLRFLESNAGRTLLIEQPPELVITNRSPLQWLSYKKVVPEDGLQVRLPQGNVMRYERGRMLIRQLAAEFPRCEVVPVYDLYASDSGVLVLDGRNLLYIDDNHLTDRGAERAAARIEQAIATSVAPRDQADPGGDGVPRDE